MTLSLSRLKPFYVSLNVRNTPDDANYSYVSSPDGYKPAIVNTDFQQPIMDKASDFLCAVERLELTLNGIPFYDGLLNERIVLVSRLDVNLPVSSNLFNITAWSLTDLLAKLSVVRFVDPNNQNEFNIIHSISEDGIIVVALQGGRTFDDIEIRYPKVLNYVIGISTLRQPTAGSYTECESLYPRADIGDNLDHLIIETSLPTNSDSLGNEKRSILTDLSVGSVYGNSLSYGQDGELIRSSFTSNIRQRVIYTPNERRYLELLGDFPIQNIQVTVLYKNILGSVQPVPLPLGGYFELKLGFYLRQ